jgi:hypothetical protein
MNISDTIAPKVDQLTADHLVGGESLTIRITSVKLSAAEQPCDIDYEGCNGLPYRPGKSMRRVLVHAWGGDISKYVGRRLRLFRDDDVQFGALKVGGIRISHMSDIAGPLTIALTAKKGSKKAFRVLPLEDEQTKTSGRAEQAAHDLVARIREAPDMAALQAVTADAKVVEQRKWMAEKRPDLAAVIDAAVAETLAAIEQAEAA